MREEVSLYTQVGNDDYVGIHGSLYRMLDILKPELVSALKFGEGLSLTEEGAGLVENVVSLAAYDLRYNPRSQASWDSIASALRHTAGDLNLASIASFRCVIQSLHCVVCICRRQGAAVSFMLFIAILVEDFHREIGCVL